MTPSGFSIGTTLKTKISLSAFASLSFDTINSRKPSMMNDAFVSPGCTRELIIMHLRSAIASYDEAKFVIISNSTVLPA